MGCKMYSYFTYNFYFQSVFPNSPKKKGSKLCACVFINVLVSVPVLSFTFRKYFIKILDSKNPEDLFYKLKKKKYLISAFQFSTLLQSPCVAAL
jgi:hypothetical protein